MKKTKRRVGLDVRAETIAIAVHGVAQVVRPALDGGAKSGG